MQIVLIGLYELGRQPFGLASPAAWLRERGHRVVCCDLAVDRPDLEDLRAADLVAFYLPMHTATRLACGLIAEIRRINPRAVLCCYGLYAPLNASHLQHLGVDWILGGEFEGTLADLVDALTRRQQPVGPKVQVSIERLTFRIPDRSTLPPLERYARLVLPGGEQRLVGYTEASRGCKHRCRHCPVVPVYNGRFRVVPHDVVVEDIRRQVAAGAQHITFGDPDFLNGPRHALELVQRLHAEFPALTYDITAKVEHLLQHAALLPVLRDTGCLFVTTAVESLDNAVLARLDKGHTREDFFRLVELFRCLNMVLHPTFIPFTPWTTLESYAELLDTLERLELVEHVAPVQLTLRLLIPAGSRLLELDEIRSLVDSFDSESLTYPWRHPDVRVDQLQERVLHAVEAGLSAGASRTEIFANVRALLDPAVAHRQKAVGRVFPARCTVPYLTEPWYC